MPGRTLALRTANERVVHAARKLVDKATQGVKVRVLIDANGSGAADKWKDLVHFLQNGVAIVVNSTRISSSNLDARSLEFNDELNSVIVAQSTRVTQASSGPKIWFIRLVSPWL